MRTRSRSRYSIGSRLGRNHWQPNPKPRRWTDSDTSSLGSGYESSLVLRWRNDTMGVKRGRRLSRPLAAPGCQPRSRIIGPDGKRFSPTTFSKTAAGYRRQRRGRAARDRIRPTPPHPDDQERAELESCHSSTSRPLGISGTRRGINKSSSTSKRATERCLSKRATASSVQFENSNHDCLKSLTAMAINSPPSVHHGKLSRALQRRDLEAYSTRGNLHRLSRKRSRKLLRCISICYTTSPFTGQCLGRTSKHAVLVTKIRVVVRAGVQVLAAHGSFLRRRVWPGMVATTNGPEFG